MEQKKTNQMEKIIETKSEIARVHNFLKSLVNEFRSISN